MSMVLDYTTRKDMTPNFAPQFLFNEGELSKESTVAEFATVQTEGTRQVERQVEHYNLDVIISVGYRVKSFQRTQFRIWATQRPLSSFPRTR